MGRRGWELTFDGGNKNLWGGVYLRGIFPGGGHNQIFPSTQQGKPCYYMLSCPSFRSAFVFSINSLTLSSVDFFSFSWILIIMFFVALCSRVCSCPKISGNIFYLYLFLVLILQSTYFICTTWKRKQTTEQQLHRACEPTK